MELVKRGKVREIYEIDEKDFRRDNMTNTNFNYRTANYIIEGRTVLSPKTEDMIGTLFDDGEMERVIKATETSKESVDALLDDMFLKYQR